MSYIKEIDANINSNELGFDAWGRNKVVTDYSMFHGIFTFDVPNKLWIEYYNGVEQVKTNATSVNGMLNLVSNGGSTYLMSKRHPRYQPNRGMLYSNSQLLDGATPTNGKLYAVVRTTIDGITTDDKKLIQLDAIDPAKGNIYDIQSQWRGVGNIKFFINQKEVVTFNYLGSLDELSVSNPALPLGFECTNLGITRFGQFTPSDGMFFEWAFDVAQETNTRCGCVDVTSEGGFKENRQYLSASTSTESGSHPIDGYNDPVLAIRLPDMFLGKMNTRDCILTRVSGYSDQKSVMRIWYTRNGVGVNGGTWGAINGGNVEVSENITSINTAQLQLIHSVRVDQDATISVANPDADHGDLFLVHGDYLVVTIHRETGGDANAGVTIEMAEEI
jgi:hypothetical protein